MLSPEWRLYCAHKRYEANQKKKKKKSHDMAPHNKGKKKQGRFNKKKTDKYIQEAMAKHTADLESKFN